MIELWMILCFMVGMICFVVGVTECTPKLLYVSGVAVIIALISIFNFASSNYNSWKDTDYPVSIGPNNAAFIYVEDCALNVNRITDKNFKDGDTVTIREYQSYWSGNVFVDKKTEFIAKHKE